eukprot:evm.model.scf_222.3 EVM.evm.TU.scf_222.3   scf_222:23899-25048(+)
MVVRMLAAGGIAQYLKVPWNTFDCSMVLAGYTVFLPVGSNSPGASSIKALRSLRALRPLRTINRFQALKSVVSCFIEAVPLLMSVVGFLFFFLLLFGIAGIQMFMSVYHKACVGDATGTLEIPPGENQDELGCGGSRSCPTGFRCQYFHTGTNLHTAGFDNIGASMLTIFQCTTLGGWSFIMYRVVDATSYWAVLFFVTLILIGPYFLVSFPGTLNLAGVRHMVMGLAV